MGERRDAGGAEHQLVRRTRVALQKIDDGFVEHARQEAEIRERMRRGGKPDIVWVPGLHNAVGKGGVLQPPGNAAAIVVTVEQRHRALLLLGTIIGMMVSRGLRLWVEDGKTFVGRKPYTFEIRLSEIAEKSGRTPDVPYATTGWMPTGRLRITLRTYTGTSFRIVDDKTMRLEGRLESLADHVAKAVKNGPEKGRRLAELRAAHDARVAEAEEIMRQTRQAKADLELQAKMDAAHSEDLRREARAWREASEIRAYASEVLSSRSNDEPVKAWAIWAMQVADAMDPMKRRLAQIEKGSWMKSPSSSC